MEKWQKAAVERGYPWGCSCGEMHRTKVSAATCRKCVDRDPPRDMREVADAEAEAAAERSEGGAEPAQDVAAMRREYAVRRSHACYDNASRAAFDAAVRALVGEGATPEQWLAATDRATFSCRRCAGTGQFVTGMHNGKPTGPGGSCFRCEGRGAQTWRDGRRNAYYDARAFGRAAHAMMRGAA
jgi:hypothetical protein